MSLLTQERDKLLAAVEKNHQEAMQQVTNLRLLIVGLEDGLRKNHQMTIDSITGLLGKPESVKSEQGKKADKAHYDVVEEQ